MMHVMDRDYCLDVPSDFDDSAADSQVHPIARLMFFGQTNAEAFGKVHEWVGSHNVRVIDVSWNHWIGEEFSVSLTLYFSFELEPEQQTTQYGEA